MILPAITIGLAFLGLAAAIAIKQRSATTCEKHSRLAGKVAIVLAFLCASTGLSMLIFAAFNADGPSGKSNLLGIVAGEESFQIPGDWRFVKSDKYSYEMAIHRDAIWNERKVIWQSPGQPNYTFEVSARNMDYSDQQVIDEKKKFLVGTNRLIFKADPTIEPYRVHQFGVEPEAGMILLGKIVVTKNLVYVLTVSFEEHLATDPDIASFFGLFTVQE